MPEESGGDGAVRKELPCTVQQTWQYSDCLVKIREMNDHQMWPLPAKK